MIATLAATTAFCIVWYGHSRFIRDGFRRSWGIVLASWAVGGFLLVTAVRDLVLPEHHARGEVVASINGILDNEGVIHFVPPYCGPNAHFENHPHYGRLCIQNEGSWKVAVVDEQDRMRPCTDPNDQSVPSSALLSSCQNGKMRVQ